MSALPKREGRASDQAKRLDELEAAWASTKDAGGQPVEEAEAAAPLTPIPLETLPIHSEPPLEAPKRAESVTPARSASPGRPTFASIWAAANEPPRFPVRLILAMVVGATTLLVTTAAWMSWGNFSVPDIAAVSFNLTPPKDAHEALFKEALEASKTPPLVEHGLLGNAQRTDLRPVARQHGEKRTTAVSRHGTPSQGPASPPPGPAAPLAIDETDPAFRALYGSELRYQQAAARPSSGATTTARAASGPSARGTILHGRLQDQVSTDRQGSPVVAVLTQRATLGTTVLPVGTELHGAVVDGGSTRVFIDFSFARRPDGHEFEIAGSARDENGRQGLPGKVLVSKHTAGSVGLSSATRALRAAGRELAGVAGAVVGAGIEAAADSSADKAMRSDRDEAVVVAAAGTRLGVYLTALRAL